MMGASRVVLLSALAAGVVSAGGCTTTVPAKTFIATYSTNIDVPNPDHHRLPMRVFLGQADNGYFYIKDHIPFRQGGGLFGKVIYWRCPAYDLPKVFPEAFRPGDLLLDGRAGAGHTYVIQSYASPPAAGMEPTATAPAAP